MLGIAIAAGKREQETTIMGDNEGNGPGNPNDTGGTELVRSSGVAAAAKEKEAEVNITPEAADAEESV